MTFSDYADEMDGMMGSPHDVPAVPVDLGSRWHHKASGEAWTVVVIDGSSSGPDSIVLLGSGERTRRVWSDYLSNPDSWERLP